MSRLVTPGINVDTDNSDQSMYGDYEDDAFTSEVRTGRWHSHCTPVIVPNSVSKDRDRIHTHPYWRRVRKGWFINFVTSHGGGG